MTFATAIGAIPGTPTSWVVVVAGLTAVLLLFIARQSGWGAGTVTVVDRYVPEARADGPSLSGAFDLTPAERMIVGVRARGDDVTFGASGSQWTGSLVGASVALVALGVALAVSAHVLLIVALAVVSICAIAAAITLRRVEVHLNSTGVSVRGRIGGRRSTPWNEIDGVEIEVHEAGWPRQMSFTSPTFVQGVLQLPGDRRVALPGFRSRQWFPERRRDSLTSADAKVAIVVRYRRSVA